MEFTMSLDVVTTGVIRNKYLRLRRSADLDFIPHVGMSLALGEDDGEYDIERVIYDVKKKRFTIVFEDIHTRSADEFDESLEKQWLEVTLTSIRRLSQSPQTQLLTRLKM